MNATSGKYPYGSETTSYVDVQNILNAIRRRAVPILVTIIIVLGLAAVTFALTKPKYSAVARVGIERQNEEVVNAVKDSVAKAPLTTDSSSVDTEVAQITSEETLGRVVDKLGLASNPGFAGDLTGTAARALAITTLGAKLDVERDGDSYAIKVTYQSTDPKTAATIVNTTIDAYLDRQQEQKRTEREREINLLKARIDPLQTEVLKAEAEVARFQAATNLVTIQNNATSAQQSIAVLGQQLAGAQAEQAVASARNTANSARSAGSGGAVGSPVIQQLRAEEAKLSAQRAALSDRYGPQHPALIEVDQQLAETRRQLDNEVVRVRQGLAAEEQVARQRASSIQSSMNAQKGQLLQGNAASVRLAELQREADSKKSLYEALLDRYRQSVARQGTERSGAYIIAHALIPQTPDGPNPLTFGAGGLISALLAAAFLTVGLEMTENGFFTRRQIEQRLQLPVLASIPDLSKLDKNKVASPSPISSSAHLIEFPGGIFSESLRGLRTALRIGREGQTIRSVAVSSALPNEGKTTTSFSLARSAALSGLRVVLVDCDLRRQASSRQMDDPIEYGLIEVLRGEATLAQALTKDSASGAFLLPQRTAGESHYDAIAGSEMQALVEKLKAEFDLVILDTAPILAIADSRAVASMADATVLAVRWRKSPAQAVEMALDQLALAEAKVAGVVLTMVDIQAQMRAGGGDELRYYKSYSQYYS